ncbi:MAG TPA: hypothetical protein VHW65_11885 [Gemmatimonadales bacterium]|nr:hypothetical protein [Gemmatimonadales bacterium]
MRRAARILTLGFLAACAGGTAGPLAPMPVPGFNPENRVVIGDFSRVMAIASTVDRVYVVYPSGVGVWRPLERRWEVPVAPADAASLSGITAAIVDPADRTLWLAAGAGWLHYDPVGNRWDRGALPARAEGIAVDATSPSDGVWFKLAAGWVRQPRFGGAPVVVPRPPNSLTVPPTPEDAMRALPLLRGLSARALMGPQLSQGRFTAAAPDPTGRGWYIGTSNRGLLYLDQTATDFRVMSAGLPGNVIGALAVDSNGVWVANDANTVQRAGVTWLSNDLARASTLVGDMVTGIGFSAGRALLVEGDSVWLASDRGLVRLTDAGARVDRWEVPQGLPDPRVLSVTRWHGRIAAGTATGVALQQADGAFVRLGVDLIDPVYALFAVGDTLWVGTSRGLYGAFPGDAALRVPKGYQPLLEASVPTAIVSIARVADTLLALTRDRLLWRSPADGIWHEGPLLSGQLGPLRAMAATADGVWVGGLNGAAYVRPSAGMLHLLTVSRDLPGEVTSIATAGRYLWIGTPRGLVRFLLDPQ